MLPSSHLLLKASSSSVGRSTLHSLQCVCLCLFRFAGCLLRLSDLALLPRIALNVWCLGAGRSEGRHGCFCREAQTRLHSSIDNASQVIRLCSDTDGCVGIYINNNNVVADTIMQLIKGMIMSEVDS